jgi:hypothetical protein
MKTRSQTEPKPLKTVALAPRPGSPKRRPRPKPKPAGKGDPRAPKKPPTAFFYFMYVPRSVRISSLDSLPFCICFVSLLCPRLQG